jgi:hypothetical protein
VDAAGENAFGVADGDEAAAPNLPEVGRAAMAGTCLIQEDM